MQTTPQSQPGPSGALWRQDTYSPILNSGIQGAGGFAIPISVGSGSYSQDPVGGMYPSSPQIEYGGSSRPRHVRAGSDPILLARYSTPLPLPRGATIRSQHVSPPPAPEPTYPPLLPAKETPTADPTRSEALRRAEEEAKRKHEQELKDLELAMQLDRELNFS